MLHPLYAGLIAITAVSYAAADTLHVPSKPYPTIDMAVGAASEGDTILVAPGTHQGIFDIDFITLTIVSSGGADVTTIDFDADGDAGSFIDEGAHVTIEGFTIVNLGGEPPSSPLGLETEGFNVSDGSTLNLTDCIFGDSLGDGERGGAVYARTGSSVVVGGCAFNATTASGSGGALYVSDGSLIVTDSTFTSCSAGAGGAIYVIDSTADTTITGCTFTGCFSSNGGAVFIHTSTTTLTGNTFTSCTASFGEGGAISLQGGSGASGEPSEFLVDILDCDFESCASSLGGSVSSFFGPSTITISDSTFTGNSASSPSSPEGEVQRGAPPAGGAIFMLSGSLTIDDSSFVSNFCQTFGGAICHIDTGMPQGGKDGGGGIAVIEITNTSFEENSADISKFSSLEMGFSDSEGGACYFDAGLDITFTGCTFSDNEAMAASIGSGSGGAVFLDRCTEVFFQECSFTNNTATSWTLPPSNAGKGGGDPLLTGGGAVLVYGNNPDDTCDFTSCIFTANESVGGTGGAIKSSYIDSILNNCDFENNSSSDEGGDGGAIHHLSGPFYIELCTFTGNSATYVGAVHVGSADLFDFSPSGAPSDTFDVTIEYCDFTSNTGGVGLSALSTLGSSSSLAGGLLIDSASHVGITQSTFTDNTLAISDFLELGSSMAGGNVLLSLVGSATVTDTSIIGGNGTVAGMGIITTGSIPPLASAAPAEFNITNCVFTDCLGHPVFPSIGGLFFSASTSTVFSVTGCSFLGCTGLYAGGLCTTDTTDGLLTIVTDSTFYECESLIAGGALLTTDTIMSGCRFEDISSDQGAACCATTFLGALGGGKGAVTMSINDCTFSDNILTGDDFPGSGPGLPFDPAASIAVDSEVSMTISDTTFCGGSTDEIGGDYDTDGGLTFNDSCRLWEVVSISDFDGDGKDDIFWRNAQDGQNWMWIMDGNQPDWAACGPVESLEDTNWEVVGAADFSNDGKQDIFWRNMDTGQNQIWFMNGRTVTNIGLVTTVSDTSWVIPGFADFNGDGYADVVWQDRNPASETKGTVAIWLLDHNAFVGAAFLETVVSDLNWGVDGTGDYNGDGNADIVWRNMASSGEDMGKNAIWLLDGTDFLNQQFINSVTDTNWTIDQSGDFNGDGTGDIVWRNTVTGENAIWLMDGVDFLSAEFLPTMADLDWSIRGVGDFWDDGSIGLFWRNTESGENLIWLLDGTSVDEVLDTPSIPSEV